MNKDNYLIDSVIANRSTSHVSNFFRDLRPESWPLLLGAFASAYGIGLLAMLVLPFMIGGTMSGLRLDEAQAGLLGTIEFVGLMVSSLVVAPFIGRLPRRTLAVVGSLVAIAGNFASIYQSTYESLLILRPLVGLGCGLALAAGNATVASAANPEKIAAQMSILFVVLMVVAMEAFSVASEKWDHIGVYGALSLFMGVLFIFTFLLPQRASKNLAPKPEHAQVHAGLITLPAILMLLAMFAFALRDTMMWAFAERIGQSAGYTTETLGSMFSAQAVVGLIGPVVAAAIGAKFGLRKPTLIGIVLTGIVTFTILQSSSAKIPYFVAVMFIAGSYFYALSYLTAVAAELDKEGRVVAASGGFLVAGVAVGPAASGYLIVHGGYELSSWVNVGIVFLTLALLVVPLRKVSR